MMEEDAEEPRVCGWESPRAIEEQIKLWKWAAAWTSA